jgi:hypothetical protein
LINRNAPNVPTQYTGKEPGDDLDSKELSLEKHNKYFFKKKNMHIYR